MQLPMSQQRESYERHGGVPSAKDKRKKRLYNRYFEGYTAFYVPQKSGKMKLVRIYTEPYYRQKLSNSRMVLVRALYLLAFLASAACYLCATLSDCYCNTLWYTTVFQFLTAAAMTWYLSVLFTYLTNNFNLTIYGYKASSQAMLTSTLYCIGAMTLSVISYLAALLMSGGRDAGGVLLAAGLATASALMLLLCRLVEKKIEYIRVENDYVLPEGAVQL